MMAKFQEQMLRVSTFIFAFAQQPINGIELTALYKDITILK